LLALACCLTIRTGRGMTGAPTLSVRSVCFMAIQKWKELVGVLSGMDSVCNVSSTQEVLKLLKRDWPAAFRKDP